MYHLPLFDFLNLITMNCVCQYFVKRFLKYFFVSVNLLTLNRLSQYIVIVNTKNTIFLKNILILFYQTSVRLYSAQIVQIQKQNIRSTFGKMGKNRRIMSGGIKNQSKCSVFPAAYKLDYPHTNLIFKHSNKI